MVFHSLIESKYIMNKKESIFVNIYNI